MSGVVWALPCALGAAASFGIANVVQMRAARRTGTGDGIDARLLLRLATDRSWLLGLATSTLGYALQALALFLAPVVLVQPLIVTELLFALPLGQAERVQEQQLVQAARLEQPAPALVPARISPGEVTSG